MTECCHNRSQPPPKALTALLLLLLLLAASLMQLPTMVFLLLAEVLRVSTAGICGYHAVYVCLHRRQHSLLRRVLMASSHCADACQ